SFLFNERPEASFFQDFPHPAIILVEYSLLEDLGIGPAVMTGTLQTHGVALHIDIAALRLPLPATIGNPPEIRVEPVAEPPVQQPFGQPFQPRRPIVFLASPRTVMIVWKVISGPAIGLEEPVQLAIAAHGHQRM